jgi:hypothetical protein
MARINEPVCACESSRMLFAAGPCCARSFCGDLSHRQAAHLQSATQRQANHGKGADQHADRDQLACAVTHRITKARCWSNGEPHRHKKKVPLYPIAEVGTSKPLESLPAQRQQFLRSCSGQRPAGSSTVIGRHRSVTRSPALKLSGPSVRVSISPARPSRHLPGPGRGIVSPPR